MELIATTTLTSGSATITLSSLPQTYTDLMLLLSARSPAAGDYSDVYMTLNGNTGSALLLRSDSWNAPTSTTDGSNMTVARIPAANAASGIFGNATIYFPNYTAAQAKIYNAESTYSSTSGGHQFAIAGLWSNASAINQISFTVGGTSSFLADTSVSIYGITKGSGGATVS